jgi:hypothetical protein
LKSIVFFLNAGEAPVNIILPAVKKDKNCRGFPTVISNHDGNNKNADRIITIGNKILKPLFLSLYK